MKLETLMGKIPCKDNVVIMDYLTNFTYADNSVENIMDTKEYHSKLRRYSVYGISAERNVLHILVLNDKAQN